MRWICILAFISTSAAAINVEPYGGVLSNGKTTYEYNGVLASTFPGTYEDKLKGNAYGLKLTTNISAAFLGLDYMKGKGKIKTDPDLGAEDGRFKFDSLYATAGFGHPGGFRIWYAHGLKDRAERENGGDVTKLEGDSYKIGICVGLSWLSLNAEYIKWKFKKYEQGAMAGPIGDLYKKFDSSGVFISLSAPISL